MLHYPELFQRRKTPFGRAEIRKTGSCLLVKYASVRLYRHANSTWLREPVSQLQPEVPGYILTNLPPRWEGHLDARYKREIKETANDKKPKGRKCTHIEALKFPGHELAVSPSLKNWVDCARRWILKKWPVGCRDETKKSGALDVSEGNWKHRKYHVELTSPRSLVWDFLQWLVRTKKFPGHSSSWPPYVNFVGSPRPMDTFGQCRIAAGNIARTLRQYFFGLPKTSKTETKGRRFAGHY